MRNYIVSTQGACFAAEINQVTTHNAGNGSPLMRLHPAPHKNTVSGELYRSPLTAGVIRQFTSGPSFPCCRE